MAETTIPPALSDDEWVSVAESRTVDWMEGAPLTGVGIGYTNGDFPTGRLHNPYSPVQLIALLNAALPDSDPRKITRETVDALRALYQMGCSCGVITAGDNKRWDVAQDRVPQIIAALESYLPPEGA